MARWPDGLATMLAKFDYTYDVVGNILTWRQQADSTAVLWKYGYDPADQLTSAVKHATDTNQTILQRFAYAYDPAGNRTVEQIDDAVMLSAYDNLNRLTSQAPGGPMVIADTLNEPGTVTISGRPAIVDANNNFRGTVPTTIGTNAFTIVARDVTGNTTTQQYEVDLVGGTKSFTYDANGNLTADGTRTFEWDALDRLRAVAVGSRTVAFDYDGFDQRVHRSSTLNSVLEQETRIVICDEDICETRDAAGTNILGRSFPRGESSSSASYFVDDHLGSIGAVTDGSSSVTGQMSYSPMGSQTIVSGSNTSQGFAAYYGDANLPGLWFTKYRVLDAGAARWLSEDPIGMADDKNLYRYVANRPLTLTDPSGLAAWLRCEYIKQRSEPGGYRINYKIPFRHCYVDVACDSANAILEMWGPEKAGDKYGRPKRLPRDPNRNSHSTEQRIDPPSDNGFCGEDCQFEKKLIDCYEKLKDQIPPYNPSGPNSNTFASSIISCAGGKTKFPFNAPGAGR